MLRCVIKFSSFAVQSAITIFTVLIVVNGRRDINSSNPCPNVQPSKYNSFTKHSVPGATWLCCLCPSGTYLEMPCLSEKDFRSTMCTPCLFNPGNVDQQYYIDVEPHNITKCMKAIATCQENMIRIQGNSTHPAECRCKEGTYFKASVERCKAHAPCKPGYGMVLPGNYTNDTYCVWCHEGHESPNFSLTEKCTKINYSMNDESSSKSQLSISTTIGHTEPDVTSTTYLHEATETPDTTAISTGGTSPATIVVPVIIIALVVACLVLYIIWKCKKDQSCGTGICAAHQEENGNGGQSEQIVENGCSPLTSDLSTSTPMTKNPKNLLYRDSAPAPRDNRANGYMGNMQAPVPDPDVPPGEDAPLLQNEDDHDGVDVDYELSRVTYRQHRNDLDGDIAERQVIVDGLVGNESEDGTSEDGEAPDESEAATGEIGSARGVPGVADRASAAANSENDRVNCQDAAAAEQLIVDLPPSDTNGMTSSDVRDSTGSQDVSSVEMSRDADDSLSTGRDNVSCDEANTAKEDLRVSIPATTTADGADDACKALSCEEQMEKIRMRIQYKIGEREIFWMYRFYRSKDEQFIDLLIKMSPESERFNKAFAELIKLGKNIFNPQSLRKCFADDQKFQFVEIIDDVIGADSE